MREVSEEFLDFVDTIRGLIRDYRANTDEIERVLVDASLSGLALRYFLRLSLDKAQYRVLVGDNSYVVHAEEDFCLRINLWQPYGSKISAINPADIERFQKIDQWHNHNYDFFTVGILGPGYTTDFLVTRKTKKWIVGEMVDFERHFSACLSMGEFLFVPKDSHFHVQHAPERFSASLNLIPTPDINSFGYGLKQGTRQVNSIFADNEPIEMVDEFKNLSFSFNSRLMKEFVRSLSRVDGGLAKELIDQYEAAQ